MSVYDTEDTHVNANLSYLARRRHQIVISVSWEMKDWMRDSFAEIDQSCCGSKKRRPTLSPPRWYQLFRFHLNPFRERKVFFANCSRFAGSCLELPSEACRDRLFCWTLVNAVSEPLSRTAGRSTFKLGKRGEHGVFLTRPICVCNVSSNLCNWPVRDEEGDVWALNFHDNMLRIVNFLVPVHSYSSSAIRPSFFLNNHKGAKCTLPAEKYEVIPLQTGGADLGVAGEVIL